MLLTCCTQTSSFLLWFLKHFVWEPTQVANLSWFISASQYVWDCPALAGLSNEKMTLFFTHSFFPTTFYQRLTPWGYLRLNSPLRVTHLLFTLWWLFDPLGKSGHEQEAKPFMQMCLDFTLSSLKCSHFLPSHLQVDQTSCIFWLLVNQLIMAVIRSSVYSGDLEVLLLKNMSCIYIRMYIMSDFSLFAHFCVCMQNSVMATQSSQWS